MIRPISMLASRAAIILLLAGAAVPAPAQKPVVPTIAKYSDISVGSIVPGASPGTVILDAPSGGRTATGGTNLGTAAGASLGTLTLSGKPGDTWSISAGSSIPFILTGSNGGTLQVTTVVFEPSATNTGIFPASGTTGTFYLGLTLAVGTSPSTPSGTYSGAFTLRVTDTVNGKTSTTNFSVRAKVDPVITLVKLADLRFGDIIAGPTAGTATLTPAGGRSGSGGVMLGSASPWGPATFSVAGAASTSYAILLPAGITLTSPGGATLTVSPLASTPGAMGFLDASGQQTLAIGGTLNVAARQAEGTYSGTFNVTVAYN